MLRQNILQEQGAKSAAEHVEKYTIRGNNKGTLRLNETTSCYIQYFSWYICLFNSEDGSSGDWSH